MHDSGTPEVPTRGDVFARRYGLLEPLDAQGEGRVFRARDHILARDVAVKLFDAVPAAGPRGLEGARMLTALDHPSLATLYDAHVAHDGRGYLVMEFVDGPSVRQHLEEHGRLAPAVAAAVVRDIARGLAAIHELGIVHGRLSSSTVLLRPLRDAARPFTAVLTDYGVTTLLGEVPRSADGGPGGPAREYLPPERLRGGEPRAASDVYALGLIAMEVLTGEGALSGGPMQDLLLAPLAYDPEIPSRFGYGWELLLTALTDPDPDRRPTATEVAALALELIESDSVASSTSSVADAVSSTGPVAAVQAIRIARETTARRRRPPIWAWVTHYR